jgi:MFS family permease
LNARPVSRQPFAGLAVVGLGASIAPLDFSVNIAFPAIAAAFALETREIRWVAVSYVLTYGSLMLAFGALGDRIGHVRVFRAGLLLGALAFTWCAMAPSYDWLLTARVLQGIAVALTLSCAPALATSLFDEGRRTWALSMYGGMAALAGVIAPLVGGITMGALGWPGVYWFRVPVVLLAFFCVPLLVHHLAALPVRKDQTFDVVGMTMLASSTALLLLAPAIMRADALVWPALPLALGGSILMFAFLVRQRASATPFLPRAVVRDPGFVIPNLAAVVVQATSFSIPLVLPFYLTRMGGWEPLANGALIATWAAGALGGSGIAPRLVRMLGVRRAAFSGGVLVALGLACIAPWPAEPQVVPMLACLVVQGVGIGLYQVAYSDIVVAALPMSQRGVAGSLTMVTRTIGIVLGVSLLTWLVQRVEAAGLARGADAGAAFMAAFEAVFSAAAAVAAGTFALSALRRQTWFDRATRGA